MRLIDADELIKDRVENDPVRIALMCAPTAYDVDKVVERLMCESINCHIMTDRAVEIVRSGGVQYPDSAHTDIGNETVNWKEHMEARFNRFE